MRGQLLLLTCCVGLTSSACAPPWPAKQASTSLYVESGSHRHETYYSCGRRIRPQDANDALDREPSSHHAYRVGRSLEIDKLGAIPLTLTFVSLLSGIAVRTALSFTPKEREGDIIGGALFGLSGLNVVALLSMIDSRERHQQRAVAAYNEHVRCQDDEPRR